MLSAVLLACLCGLAFAQGVPDKKARAAAHEFAISNSLFVLLHEVGHLLIDQLELPVLGREEDAADNMASWMLLTRNSPEDQQVLADAAYGWLLSGIAYGRSIAKEDYYAAHTLDRQRAYQIACLMIGSNGDAFRGIANGYAIGSSRQDTCHWDYELIDRSMRALLDSHLPKKAVSAGVKVTYHDATGRLAPTAEAFRKSGLLDRLADRIETDFPLSRQVTLSAKRCGEPNAFYDSEAVEIIYCYELMEEFINLALKDMEVTGRLFLAPANTGRAQQ